MAIRPEGEPPSGLSHLLRTRLPSLRLSMGHRRQEVSAMHFTDQLTDPNQKHACEAALAQLARFVEDCSRFTADACTVLAGKTLPEKAYYHTTITLLMRHVVEAIDGVSLLVAKGSADNC